MMSIIKQLNDSVTEILDEAAKISKFRMTHYQELCKICKALKPVNTNLIRVTIDPVSQSVDFSFTGDAATLGAIFKALRKTGYEPDCRPNEPKEYFHTWFRKPGVNIKLYLSFSSNKCVRTKVGTETQEVDVFEVICE